ncbi:hypothetical protein PRNP1_013318 [Phytophthora ramorum]
MRPPCSSTSSLFCSPHSQSLDSGPFPLYGGKAELTEGLEPGSAADAMATRRASLVAPSAAPEEPEQEQEVEDKTPPGDAAAVKTEVHVIKRRNVGVPKFLRFLFQILEAEDPGIVTWSHGGTAFQIIQPEELANQILPKYFKHNKVSSFQRQLNYFGFKKWTKTQTNICTFSHPFFLRADKERMKLIKRKERSNPAVMSAAMAAAISSNPIHIMNQIQAREQELSQAQAQFEAHDLAEARNQLPTQQALKRQKSNTLSGATVTFLNSAAAGRRHSTGMLPGSEAFGFAAAAAAAAAAATASAPGRKRAGTPAEQEFELEMEARSGAAANASSAQQQLMYLRKIAEAKELAQGYPFQSSRGKRQSLPHVVPPTIGMGMAMNMPNVGGNGSFAPRGAVYLGRRRSDQLLTDFNIGSKAPTISQLEEFMSSSATSGSQQTIFASSLKNDASVVLPVSSNSLAQDTYQLQQQQRQQQLRQQMNRQQHIFAGSGYGSLGVKPESGNEWSASVKPEVCSGWPSCINANPSSTSNTSASYPPQQNHSMMTPFKFGDPNAPYQGGVSSLNYSRASSDGEQKLHQRPPMSHPQPYQSQQQRVPYQQQESDQHEEARDYIDVLLESAGLDDNLPPQTSTTLSSESWNEPSYSHSQQGHSGSGSEGSYPFLQPQQQGQLSPMEGMPHNPRF